MANISYLAPIKDQDLMRSLPIEIEISGLILLVM